MVPVRRLVPIQPKPAHVVSGGSPVGVDASGFASSDVADAKRFKHRLAVKRAYHARLTALSRLRDQEKDLTQQMEKLLTRANTTSLSEPTPSPRTLFVKILETRRQLERENAALREVAEQHDYFQTRLRVALQSEDGRLHEEDGDDSDERQTPSLSAVLKTPPATPAADIEPLTDAACFAVIQESWPQARAFMESKRRLHMGSQVFGWTHEYRFPESDDDKPGHLLQYSISKTFPSMGAYELSQRGWEIMTTQRHYQALHSSTMSSQFHLVQRIDNDNMVFLRVMQRANQVTVFKTLLLASQFQVDGGYMTIYRGLDPKRVRRPADGDDHHVVWLDMFAWTYFEDQSDGASVRFEFGGEMRHTTPDNARFWMMEVLLMALRWENMAVGPMFNLSSEAP